MTTVEILKAARARIAKWWVQGTANVLHDYDAHCCVSATSGLADRKEERVADAFIQAAIGASSPGGVLHWNDKPGRTKEEVLAAFDKAILLAEAENKPAAGAS